MSDLSTAHASAAASAAGLLAGLRTGPANGAYGASNNAAGTSGDKPNFSSVLKERADKLTKPEGAPAEKAGKLPDARESAAESSDAANSPTDASPTANSERTARAEKRSESSAEKKADEAGAEENATDDIDNTPIAAVMVQMTPAALVAANGETVENSAIADAKSRFGAMVRELARGHGQGDKNDAGNQGLGLAVGQGEGKAGVTLGTLGDAGQSSDQPATGEQPELVAGAEGELTAALPGASDGPETPTTTLAAPDDEAALATSAPAAKGAAGDSDFNQLLTQVRDGQASGQAVGNAGRTGGSEAAMAMRSPVGHPNWSNELGDKMTWMVSSQRQQAELVLNPPQLGRIEVSLTVNGDQANAVFTSPNAAVREMLENSLPRLREILAGSGLNLGQADVGAQAFAQQQGQDGQRHSGGMRGDIGADLDTAISAGGTVNLGRAGERRGMVDIFA